MLIYERTSKDRKKESKFYTCWLKRFLYKPKFILFLTTPGAQTVGNIAVYGSDLIYGLAVKSDSSGVWPWQVLFSSVTA